MSFLDVSSLGISDDTGEKAGKYDSDHFDDSDQGAYVFD